MNINYYHKELRLGCCSLEPPLHRKSVLKTFSTFTGEHHYRSEITNSLKPSFDVGGCSPVNLMHVFRTLFPKNTFGGLLWNFIEITLCNECPPVNLLRIFRTSFPKNTSRGRLLNKIKLSNKIQVYCFFIQILKYYIQSCIHVLLVYPACIEIPL